MKALSVLVSSVVLILVIMVSTFLVVSTIAPLINRGKELSALNEGKQVLSSIDSAIQELIYEAPGAKRVLNLKATGGRFSVSGKEDKIRFLLDTTTGILEPGSLSKEGNLLISYGPNLKAYEGTINGIDSLIIENDAVLFAVRKLYNKTNPDFINTTNLITLIRNKRTDTNITPTFGIFIGNNTETSYGEGYTEQVSTGTYLPEATIKLHLNSNSGVTYEAFFTLLPGQDFVQINVKIV